MKKLILIIGTYLCLQSLGATIIVPFQDSIPSKNWNFGIQAGYQTNSRYVKGIELGLFTERKITNLFSLESELSLSRNQLDLDFLDIGKFNVNHIHISLSGKYYFGKNRNWYVKAGYTLRKDFTNFNDSSLNGPIVAFGRHVKIGKQTFKLELNATNNRQYGFMSGFKMGIRF